MNSRTNRKAGALVVAGLAVAGLGLSGCATRAYVDEQVAVVDARVTALEGRVSTAQQGADAAGADARRANDRLDALEGRVTTLEQRPLRTPRG